MIVGTAVAGVVSTEGKEIGEEAVGGPLNGAVVEGAIEPGMEGLGAPVEELEVLVEELEAPIAEPGPTSGLSRKP